jgi:osmoprotectant transport system substrate-binding protein
MTGRARIAGALLLVSIAACGRNRAGTIVVASKNFTEQSILAELVAQQIERAGLQVNRRFYLGGTLLCHQALVSGRIDVYVEYTGSAFTAILKRKPVHDPREVYRQTSEAYARQFGVMLAEPLGFNNTFAILVRGDAARRLQLKSISDAVRHSPEWKAAFGPEFMEREDGFRGLAALYGLRFREPPRVMDLGLTYRALAEGKIDLIAGDSTNGLIAALDLAALDDDRGYFPPYEAVPFVRAAALAAHPDLGPALAALGGKIPDATMRRLNQAVDGEHRDAPAVVREFLAGLPPPVSRRSASAGMER